MDRYASLVTLASVIGESLVLILLIRRSIWRTFPTFCVYVAWTLISDIGLYVIYRVPVGKADLRPYMIEATVDSLLQFAVLVELAWSFLRPVRNSFPKYSLAVLAAIVGLAGLVVWPLAGLTVPAEFTRSSQLLFHLEQTFAILRVGFFLVMACFSQILAIGWRDRELQIATGLGIYSIVSLLVALLHSHQQPDQQYHYLDMVESLSYLGTLSYWVYSFSTKEQERKEFSPQMQQFLLLMGGGARSSRIALTNLPPERFKEKEK